MVTLAQNIHTTASYLVSEANGFRSRGVGTIASGSGKLKAGTVLGKRTKGTLTAVGASGAPAPAGATITASPAVTAGVTKAGVHIFRCETAGVTGTWQHEDPDGIYVGTATTGTAYTGQGMTLTITDSGTDPAIGEVLKVTVSEAAATNKYAPINFSATDGSETAAAILFEECDATSADVRRTFTQRDSEVTSGELTWPTGATDNQKAAALAQLAALGIIAR